MDRRFVSATRTFDRFDEPFVGAFVAVKYCWLHLEANSRPIESCKGMGTLLLLNRQLVLFLSIKIVKMRPSQNFK